MGSRKRGIVVVFLLLVASIGINGLFSTASAQTIDVSIVNQPADARTGDLITAATFDPSGGSAGYVQVHVTETPSECPEPPCTPQDVQGAEVSFELATGAGLATGTLNVDSRFTNADGIATFSPAEGSDNPLNITTANNPFTTDYKLVPIAAPPPPASSEPPPLGAAFALDGTPGAASNPFDVWDDGCKGNGCNVDLTPGTSDDTYTTSEDVALGASQLLNAGNGTTIFCPTQQLIFATDLFFHATSGNGPVFLVSHISAADRKAAPQNGNKVMGWCVGLKTPGPWNFTRQDTDGNGSVGDGDLYVGMAHKFCPKKNASSFAPCITSQTGDGVGGTFIRGWLPGGDPPRRT